MKKKDKKEMSLAISATRGDTTNWIALYLIRTPKK